MRGQSIYFAGNDVVLAAGGVDVRWKGGRWGEIMVFMG